MPCAKADARLREELAAGGCGVAPMAAILSLGLEGLRHNIAVIGATPQPPAASSSLGRASALAQGMGEGLLSKLSVQAS